MRDPNPGGGWFSWVRQRPLRDPDASRKRPALDQERSRKRRNISTSPASDSSPDAVVRTLPETSWVHAHMDALAERISRDSRQAIDRAARHHDDQFRDAVWDLGVFIKQLARKSTDESMTQVGDIVHGPLARIACIQETVQHLEEREAERSRMQRGCEERLTAETQAAGHRVGELQGQVDKLEAARRAAEDKAQQLQAQLGALEQDANHQLELSNLAAESHVQELQTRIATLQVEKQAAETQNQHLHNRVGTLADEKQAAQGSAQGLQDRVRALEEQERGEKQRAQKLQARVDTLELKANAELRPRIRALEDQIIDDLNLQDQVMELRQLLQQSEEEAQQQRNNYDSLYRFRDAVNERQKEHAIRIGRQRSAELDEQYKQERISRNRDGLDDGLRHQRYESELAQYKNLAETQSQALTRAIDAGNRRLETQKELAHMTGHGNDGGGAGSSSSSSGQPRSRSDIARDLADRSRTRLFIPPIEPEDLD
ncbi:hypothetical protein ACEQ8H_008522 [Pleosporales sp. CAS-2024a]